MLVKLYFLGFVLMRSFASKSYCLHNYRQNNGEHRSNKVEPQITQFFFATRIYENSKIVNDKNGDLANDCTIKYGLCLHVLDIKTNQKNPQNRSVENGTNDVDQLDQVFEQCSNTGKKNRHNSPKEREKFSHVHIMPF